MKHSRKNTVNFNPSKILLIAFCLVLNITSGYADKIPETPTETVTLQVPSVLDGVEQPCLFTPAKRAGKRPLMVFLHSWSSHYEQDNNSWLEEAKKYDWHYLHPHFRGPNWTPEACGSLKARQDILDAVEYVIDQYKVDTKRIYLVGVSGGGHMTMVMAAHAPERWTAASAWAGISDLTAWHEECTAGGLKYAGDIEKSVGGKPGDSAEVDAQLNYRSPVHHLAKSKGLPLEIATGIHDGIGKKGSVPVHHSLYAFNTLATAYGVERIPQEIIDALDAGTPPGEAPEQDPEFTRAIHLRQEAGPSRVTIFEGGHEGIPEAALKWLNRHERQTR